MPQIAFRLESAGVSVASWSQIQLAIQRGRGHSSVQRLFTLNTTGTAGTGLGPLAVAWAETVGGHNFPEVHQNKTFPSTLAGKYIKLSFPGSIGFSERALMVTLEINEVRDGSAVELYKVARPIMMYSSYWGGMSIEGYPFQNDSSTDWVQERISDLASS